MDIENSTFDLGNDRFFKVYDWRSETRFDLRQYEQRNERLYPTQKGVSLTLLTMKTLLMEVENIDDALKNNKQFKSHIGGNMYCIVEQDSVCVNIWKYWKTPEGDVVSTKRGLTLRPTEDEIFRVALDKMEELVPELLTTIPCNGCGELGNYVTRLMIDAKCVTNTA